MRAWVVGGSSGDGNQQELRRGFGMLLVDVGLRILLEGEASRRAAVGRQSMVLPSLCRGRFWGV